MLSPRPLIGRARSQGSQGSQGSIRPSIAV